MYNSQHTNAIKYFLIVLEETTFTEIFKIKTYISKEIEYSIRFRNSNQTINNQCQYTLTNKFW